MSDVRAVGKVEVGVVEPRSALLASEISRREGISVLSAADIRTMLGFEAQKQLLGCSEDSSCLAEIGGALGADLLVASEASRLGDRFFVTVVVLDTATAGGVGRATGEALGEGELSSALRQAIAEAIDPVLARRRGGLVAQDHWDPREVLLSFDARGRPVVVYPSYDTSNSQHSIVLNQDDGSGLAEQVLATGVDLSWPSIATDLFDPGAVVDSLAMTLEGGCNPVFVYPSEGSELFLVRQDRAAGPFPRRKIPPWFTSPATGIVSRS